MTEEELSNGRFLWPADISRLSMTKSFFEDSSMSLTWNNTERKFGTICSGSSRFCYLQPSRGKAGMLLDCKCSTLHRPKMGRPSYQWTRRAAKRGSLGG